MEKSGRIEGTQRGLGRRTAQIGTRSKLPQDSPPSQNKSDPPSSNTSDTSTRLIPFSAPVVCHRVTPQQVRPTLCSKQKSTSAPLRRVLTFRHVFTPLRICTYGQLPQARKTCQTCRKACPALEQKPYRKSASIWSSQITFIRQASVKAQAMTTEAAATSTKGTKTKALIRDQ